MKKANLSMFYLCILFLLILSACGPDVTIELPPENTAAPEADAPAEPTEDEPEEPAEVDESNLEDLLEAGTAMKWYDDGYLVFVPQGEVTLGDNEYENNPVHNVSLDDFWIYMFKVTNGQYRQCIATGTCTPPASEAPYPDLEDPKIKDQPVIGVTWEQADTYCQWMNGRLPTKAQWEKAARGPQANTYPWGEDDPDCDLLNYGDCENPAITTVYEYPEGRSFYQAFDLAGNTYEWVFDLYEDDFISQLPGEEPAGPPDGTERSVRGSSYQSDEEIIPSAQLFYLEPDKYRADLGFRCVLTGAEPKTFGSPCIQTAYVPGLPAPWVPGPPPPGNPQVPDFLESPCMIDIGTSITQFCTNQSIQQGGLDLSIVALGADDVYVNSWSSNQGAVCIDGTDPLGCFGPEGASITFEICATCTPPIQVGTVDYYCENCYALEHTNPPTCVYHGSPVPGGACPAGYVYDLVNDICVKVVQISDECPDGYEYDPNTDCCVATFAEPSPDSPGSSGSYLPCPPGFGNIQLVSADSTQGIEYATCLYNFTGSEQEYCISQTYTVGHCDDPPPKRCTNPSSYTTKNSCEAALCKWKTDVTGVPETCVMPQ